MSMSLSYKNSSMPLFWLIVSLRSITATVEACLWYLSAFGPRRRPPSQPKPDEPVQASLVCATHNYDPKLLTAIDTWLANEPDEIIIVAAPAVYNAVNQMCTGIKLTAPIKIVKASAANKRIQLCEGFRLSQMPIIVVVDDDTTWTTCILSKLIERLTSSRNLGCVFPDLRLRLSSGGTTIWEQLSLLRHAGGGVNLHASHYIDGGVYCHHGATSAYRAQILKDEKFMAAFSGERWGGILLNNGDDQFLARWLERHGWETEFLPIHEGTVHTAARKDWTFVLQVLRWSRGDWRSNLSALIWERIWLTHPYTALVRLDWCLDAFVSVFELACVLRNPTVFVVGMLAASRLPRCLPQTIQQPSLVLVLPLFVLYQYMHSVVKIYALLTLNEPKWL